MSAYRDDKLLPREQAKKDLEDASPSECKDVEETIDRVLSREKDLELLRTKRLAPEDVEGLVEVRDGLMRKRLARTRQKLVTLATGVVLGLGVLSAPVLLRPHYLGEAPRLQAYGTVDFDAVECNAHNNDCTSMQSLPQDEFDILMITDISGSMYELCDGMDNDNDGVIDNLAPRNCYSGPLATRNVGECIDGVQDCVSGVWTSCLREVLPRTEIGKLERNGRDDDCNGCADNVYDVDGACLTTVAPRGPVINPECDSGNQCEDYTPCIDGMCTDF